jgi:hypothetical protein
MIRHGVGCASLERRAACTCGADNLPAPWGRIVLAAALVVAGLVVWVVW